MVNDMTDINLSAKEIASNLDEGKEDEAARQLSNFAQQLSRDDFRKLVKAVDANEKDGVGLDLVIKYDNNTPVSYTILSAELHASAKQMAQLMDTGKTADATELLNATARQMEKDNPRNPAKVQKSFGRWAMAVDAYEKDGVGSDVTIDPKKPGVTGIEWMFK